MGCKNDPIPRHAIPREKFVDILVDVHIAEGIALDKGRLKIDSVESTSLYLAVLDKYHVTSDQMMITSVYYSRHQREYKKIYTEVLDKISIMIEDETNNQKLVVNPDSVARTEVKPVK